MADEKKLNQEEETEEIETEEEEAEEEESSEDKGSGGKAGGSKKSSESSGGKNTGKTFSQEQVSKMMTKEKNQGRNAAFKELGIDPKDTKAIAMVKALIDSQKTDEQKAAEKDAETQRKNEEAEHRAIVAEAKAEAMMLGVKPQYVEDVVTLALAKMSDDSDLKTIIGEYKTKYPVWFGESEDEDEGKAGAGKGNSKGKTGQKGTGSSLKNNSKKTGSEGNQGLGARLAAQRKANNKKPSYWGKAK